MEGTSQFLLAYLHFQIHSRGMNENMKCGKKKSENPLQDQISEHAKQLRASTFHKVRKQLCFQLCDKAIFW